VPIGEGKKHKVYVDESGVLRMDPHGKFETAEDVSSFGNSIFKGVKYLRDHGQPVLCLYDMRDIRASTTTPVRKASLEFFNAFEYDKCAMFAPHPILKNVLALISLLSKRAASIKVFNTKDEAVAYLKGSNAQNNLS
jgi:hypothetical protein